MTIHIQNKDKDISIYIQDISEIEISKNSTGIHHASLGWFDLDTDHKVFAYSYLDKPMGEVCKVEDIDEALKPLLGFANH